MLENEELLEYNNLTGNEQQFEFVIENYFFAMLSFIAYHELYHILNGHLGYINNVLHLDCSLEERVMTNEEFEKNIVMQIIEANADYCAANFLGFRANIYVPYVVENNYFSGSSKYEIASFQYAMLMISVYLVFLVLENKHFKPTKDFLDRLCESTHPYSSLRARYVLVVLLARLAEIVEEKEAQSIFFSISKVLVSCDRIIYADNDFSKSLVALANTKKASEHLMMLNNCWNDYVKQIKQYAFVPLEENDIIISMPFFVDEEGNMINKEN